MGMKSRWRFSTIALLIALAIGFGGLSQSLAWEQPGGMDADMAMAIDAHGMKDCGDMEKAPSCVALCANMIAVLSEPLQFQSLARDQERIILVVDIPSSLPGSPEPPPPKVV